MERAIERQEGEDGYMLIMAIVAIFLLLLTLSVAAPRIATQIRRDRELETQHRANQYVRAIQLYYRKFPGQFPPSIDALKKTNNVRFLRQEYVDPMTGAVDWKLIHYGQNKSTVKGFFGEDLPGLPGGLGAAAGLASPNQGSTPGQTPGFGTTPASSTTGASGSNAGSASGSTTGTGSGSGSGGTDSGGTGQGLGGDGTGGGPIIGVGVPKTGAALLTVNGETNYQDWEFQYDPRIEQLRAKANLLGGGGGTTSSGLGTAPTSNSPTGSNSSNNSNNPTSTTNPTTTTSSQTSPQ